MALLACSKNPIATGLTDGSSDTRGSSDAGDVEVAGAGDTISDRQPEAAPADAGFDRQPEGSGPADAGVDSRREAGYLVDAGIDHQPETNYPVDTDHQLEAGGSETGGDGRREVGLPTGFLSVTPASVNLGTVVLGQNATAFLVVSNMGPTTSGELALSMSAGLSASGCTGALAPQASCSLMLTATPTVAGPFSGAIDISALPGTVSLQVPVSGVVSLARPFMVAPAAIDLGIVPLGVLAPPQTITITALDGSVCSSPWLVITSAQSDLGTVPVGATGTATAFTVTNSGCAASGTLAVSVSSPEFVIADDTCTGASLAEGGSCAVTLSLKPATIGAKAAVLEVTNSSGNPAVKTVTGAGVSP